MTTHIVRECPIPGCRSYYTLAIEHDADMIEGCSVEKHECDHLRVFERIAEDDIALLDMLADARPYDGPAFSGEGLGDPREYPGYVNAMRDAGRMR